MAVLVPISEQIDDTIIDKAIDQINSHLPDYAQIKANIILAQAMTFEDGLYTANMRPKREQINQHYQAKIDATYVNFSILKEEAV